MLYLVVFSLFQLFGFPYGCNFCVSLFLALDLLDCKCCGCRRPGARIFGVIVGGRAIRGRRPLGIISIDSIRLKCKASGGRLGRCIRVVGTRGPSLVLVNNSLVSGDMIPLCRRGVVRRLTRLGTPLKVCVIPKGRRCVDNVQGDVRFVGRAPVHLLESGIMALPNNVRVVKQSSHDGGSQLSLRRLIGGVSPTGPIVLLSRRPCGLSSARGTNVSLRFDKRARHKRM